MIVDAPQDGKVSIRLQYILKYTNERISAACYFTFEWLSNKNHSRSKTSNNSRKGPRVTPKDPQATFMLSEVRAYEPSPSRKH